MKIDDVVIGDRFRQDLGNVNELAQSIADVGLLHPIVITPDNVLIAGRRRLEACKLLGLVDIPATMVDLEEIAQGEFAENEMRKDFTWSERCAIADALEPEEREAATQRHGERTDIKHPENFTGSYGNALDKVAHAVGTSRPTLAKAREVVESGDDKLIQEMDRTDKVDKAYQELKRREREALPKPSLPVGKYRVIYADPPWQYSNSGFNQSAEAHYPTMPTSDICDISIAQLCTPETVLFLWATNPLLPEALTVMDAWGFEYKTNIVWNKGSAPGIGWYVKSKHELLLIGAGTQTAHPITKPNSYFDAKRGIHSRKPSIVYEIIESMYNGPYVELFARTKRDDWDSWGNEL